MGYSVSPMYGIGETEYLDDDGIEESDCFETGNGILVPLFFYAYSIEGEIRLGECWNYSLSISI